MVAAAAIVQRTCNRCQWNLSVTAAAGAGAASSRTNTLLLRSSLLQKLYQQQRQRFRSTATTASKQARKLERKAKTRAKRESIQQSTSSIAKSSHSNNGPKKSVLSWMRSLWEPLIPRIPFRKGRMDSPNRWKATAFWLPPMLLALGYAGTDPDISPYVVRASIGPSMLPTIQFVGDVWLVETGAWRKAWQRLWGTSLQPSQQQGDPSTPTSVDTIPSSYQVGDLVLWKDPKTERLSCKRIVGLGGDRVKTYGEYVDLYKYRTDLGIVWPSDAPERGLQSKESFLQEVRHVKEIDREQAIHQTMVVPPSHVWVEGDCPLFSVDSRHYGPIPASTLEGRLVMRLWPWSRPEMQYDKHNSYVSSCWISRTRPVPYATEDAYLGGKFGFDRVPRTETE